MRRIPILLLACGCLLPAQDAGDLRQQAERIRQLVEAGVLPRKALEDAGKKAVEARDEEILKQTLYGEIAVEDLTEDQTSAMVDAARRQFERRRADLEAARRLVEQGAAPRTSLAPYLEALDRSRRVLDAATARSALLEELAAMVNVERDWESALLAPSPGQPTPGPLPLVERFQGDGVFRMTSLAGIDLAYQAEFGKPLPISAKGDTALHRKLGYDHRGRVDVGLEPDSKEGVWLLRYLQQLRIPYYAFRGYVPGKSTAAHIHIGPPSLRLARAD